jgi:hypothetical protein
MLPLFLSYVIKRRASDETIWGSVFIRAELKVFSVKSLNPLAAYTDKYAGPIFRTELKVLSVKV